MFTEEKISVALLGEEKSLKKALITEITGKKLSELDQKNYLKNSKIYENDTYQFIYTPDMQRARDDIQQLLGNTPQPDMCLLPVEKGFSTRAVWEQIEDLSRKTGKPTEEFTVLLPPAHKEKQSYPFRCFTFEQLLTELQKLSKGTNLDPNTPR